MSDELMNPEEHHAMVLTANLWNHLSQSVVGDGTGRDGDIRELMFHIHGIQRAIMAQAAARAYPEKYRLLGGDRPDTSVSPYSGHARVIDDLLDHSCSCHVTRTPCGVCCDLKCPIALAWHANIDEMRAAAMDAVEKTYREQSEDRRTDEVEVVHILTLLTEQPICRTPKSEIGFVKAASPESERAISCRECRAILSEIS